MNTKEAIERVRTRFDKWALDNEDLTALQALGLVTAESEDARIRKWIIDFAKGQIDGFSLADDEECNKIASQWRKAIAYLEKQKEKPLTIESAYEKFVNSETLKEAKENKYIRAQLLWELMHNGIITEVDYQYLTDDKRKPWTAEEYRIAYQKGFDTSEQLKQKEQNGEDEECTDFTIYHPLKNGKGKYECIPYSFYGSLTSFSEDKDLIDFLRTCFYTKEECNEWIEQQKEPHYTKRNALFDKCVENCDSEVMKEVSDEIDEMLEKEQKPEWSDEDERKLQKCIKIVERWEEDYDIAYAPYSGMLKSLRPVKQEWSEEDEKIFNNIIEKAKGGHWIEVNEITWLITRYHGDVTMTEAYKMGKKAGEASHWKPSEGQMEALLNTLHPDDPYYYDLKSLYEQLNKLGVKEEPEYYQHFDPDC